MFNIFKLLSNYVHFRALNPHFSLKAKKKPKKSEVLAAVVGKFTPELIFCMYIRNYDSNFIFFGL